MKCSPRSTCSIRILPSSGVFSIMYCHVFMAPWLIIMVSGLDYWIYWHLVQSLLITLSYNNSQSIFSQTLLSGLPRTRPILILWLTSDLRLQYLHNLKVDMRTTYKTLLPLLYLQRTAYQQKLSDCCLCIRCCVL